MQQCKTVRARVGQCTIQTCDVGGVCGRCRGVERQAAARAAARAARPKHLCACGCGLETRSSSGYREGCGGANATARTRAHRARLAQLRRQLSEPAPVNVAPAAFTDRWMPLSEYSPSGLPVFVAEAGAFPNGRQRYRVTLADPELWDFAMVPEAAAVRDSAGAYWVSRTLTIVPDPATAAKYSHADPNNEIHHFGGG